MGRRALDWVYSLGGEKMNSGERLTLLYLADRRNDKTGKCFPSYERIAQDLGISKRSAIRHVEALEAMGLLKKHERRGKTQNSNQYDLSLGFAPSQSDTFVTLPESSQGDKNDATRVTTTSPKHKEGRTWCSEPTLIDNDDVEPFPAPSGREDESRRSISDPSDSAENRSEAG